MLPHIAKVVKDRTWPQQERSARNAPRSTAFVHHCPCLRLSSPARTSGHKLGLTRS